jgi:hypothetical protein
LSARLSADWLIAARLWFSRSLIAEIFAAAPEHKNLARDAQIILFRCCRTQIVDRPFMDSLMPTATETPNWETDKL